MMIIILIRMAKEVTSGQLTNEILSTLILTADPLEIKKKKTVVGL